MRLLSLYPIPHVGNRQVLRVPKVTNFTGHNKLTFTVRKKNLAGVEIMEIWKVGSRRHASKSIPAAKKHTRDEEGQNVERTSPNLIKEKKCAIASKFGSRLDTGNIIRAIVPATSKKP
jgi:hypothetical protein